MPFKKLVKMDSNKNQEVTIIRKSPIQYTADRLRMIIGI